MAVLANLNNPLSSTPSTIGKSIGFTYKSRGLYERGCLLLQKSAPIPRCLTLYGLYNWIRLNSWREAQTA